MESIDYDALALSRVTDQFRSDDAFLATLLTLVGLKMIRQAEYIKIQEDFLDIDKSTGKNLDVIGKLVGQERKLVNFIQEPYFGFEGARFAEGFDVGIWYSKHKARLGTIKVLTDTQYRRLIRARVLNNKSRCTRDEILSIVNILAGNNLSTIEENVHGVFQIKIVGDEEGIASYFLSKYRDRDTIISIPLGYRIGVSYEELQTPRVFSSLEYPDVDGVNFLTSVPYPNYMEESVSAGFSLDSAVQRSVMNETTLNSEDISSNFSFSSATVRSVLNNYTVDVENVSTSFGMAGAQITKQVNYLNTTPKIENISTAFAFTSAQITKTVNYLNTTPEVENVSASFAMTGAQITN